ncbi:MAG: tRNA pseudouridine(55) synthase TruB, partial [Candidatus Competibacteraceae bacterium]
MTARDRRSVSGVLLLDKPVGWTSNAALQAVKRLYRAQKAGHTGSLDPLASGLLPLCLGEATKLSGLLLNADKSYRFICRLGATTTTGDADGEIVLTRPVGGLSRARVEDALQHFRGVIRQVPPMYSALKRDGQPLYKLARQGLEVEREPREVTIHELRLLDFKALPGQLVQRLAVALQGGVHRRDLP